SICRFAFRGVFALVLFPQELSACPSSPLFTGQTNNSNKHAILFVTVVKYNLYCWFVFIVSLSFLILPIYLHKLAWFPSLLYKLEIGTCYRHRFNDSIID